jgi:hypothetical protein
VLHTTRINFYTYTYLALYLEKICLLRTFSSCKFSPISTAVMKSQTSKFNNNINFLCQLVQYVKQEKIYTLDAIYSIQHNSFIYFYIFYRILIWNLSFFPFSLFTSLL